MATIWLECPDTLRLLSSEIETDIESFRALPEVPIRTQCPHCGREHTWWVSEGWLGAHDAVTAEVEDDGALAIEAGDNAAAEGTRLSHAEFNG